ncbi:MAG: ABC transporter permease [Candidatus Woesearchaeota archaeon]
MRKDYAKISLKNLKNRKLRSYLTILGIIIGVAAVVGLISIGEGLQNAIDQQFRELGADKILVSPAGGQFSAADSSNNPLTQKDIDAIKRASGVSEVGGVPFRSGQVEWGRDDIGFYAIVGIETDSSQRLIEETLQIDLIEGRTLRQGDRRRAVVGYDYANFEGFQTNLRVGRSIQINGERFEVIGINQRLGNEPDDRSVFITKQSLEDIFITNGQVNQIIVQVNPGREPVDVVPAIEQELRRERNVQRGQEDFEVDTFENVISSFLDIFLIVQTVIVGIASISLLVGGIGIMNTMYTSVLERTKEIGTMKAIGAKNSDILSIFLFESGLLGLVGGIIGITIGIGFAKLVEIAALQALGTEFIVITYNWTLIIGALLFSFIIGLLSGYLPSKRASKMNPVDALRGAE